MNRIIDTHADDYALSENSDNNILTLCENGFLDSISIIPNLRIFESAVRKFKAVQEKSTKNILVSVHLNFMEGHPCAEISSIPDLVDSNGLFSVSWGKPILWNYIPFFRAKIKEQLKVEMIAQIQKCVTAGICECKSIRLDSHQHPHMIPVVFEALKETVYELESRGYAVTYIRNTFDPISFYHGKSLFSVNVLKCFILNFFSRRITKYIQSRGQKINYLCGVYYSGQMDFRIKNVLPVFQKKAEKKNRTVELLFHPGTMLENELTDEFTKTGFNDFHLSENRKIEYSTLQKMEISK